MNFLELLIIAVALAMDAFAVSICKGLATKQSYLKTGVVCGAWFGFFQGLMPLLGYLLGATVADYVEQIKGYIVFALLAFLGVKMIIEAVKDSKEENAGCGCCSSEETGEPEKDSSLAPFIMFTMAIATSIDALATGLTFAATGANIWIAISLIGAITFLCCFIGSIVGAKVGAKCKTQAEIAGGVILVAIGVKFLIEQLALLF